MAQQDAPDWIDMLIRGSAQHAAERMGLTAQSSASDPGPFRLNLDDEAPAFLDRTYHHAQIWTGPGGFTVAVYSRGALTPLRSFETLQEAFDFARTVKRKHRDISLRGALVEAHP